MKRRSITVLFLLTIVYVLFTASSGGRATVANSGNTGAPNESQTCGNCHSGGAFGPVTVTIQVFQLGTTTPVTSYVPGTQYDMRVTVQGGNGNPSGYGFQLTCLTTPGNLPLAGYSNLASNVKQKTVTVGTYAGRTYTEHNGVTSNNQFNFRWTAPVAGTGSVRFYSSGNAVNGNGSTSLDNGGSTSLTLQESLPLVVNSSVEQPSCPGEQGSIDLTITGGTPPYSTSWSNGSVSEDQNSLDPGSYSVTITDANGGLQNLGFTITAPAAIDPGITAQDALMPGENATITFAPTGGTPPLTATIDGVVVDIPAVVSASETGCYTLIATDSNGCSIEEDVCVFVPEEYVILPTIEEPLCAGGTTGSVTLGISGGTPPYTITWNTGDEGSQLDNLSAGTYLATITDNNGYSAEVSAEITEPLPLIVSTTEATLPCEGGTAPIIISAEGGTPPYSGVGEFMVSSAGQYSYPVSDANGCTVVALAEVIAETGLSAQATVTPGTCSASCDGAISLEIFNANEPIVLTWDNGSSEPAITDLCPGTYTFSLVDNNQCVLTGSYIVNAPPALVTDLSSGTIACYGGFTEVNATVSGGTPPYSYAWSDGSSEGETEAGAGVIFVNVTDGAGCNSTASIELTEPDALEITVDSFISGGLGVGEVSITVTGGTPPYTFEWSDGSTTEDTNLPTNSTHTVTVTDANGCTIVSDVFEVFDAVQEVSVSPWRLYPNPATEEIHLESLNGQVIQEVCIITLQGRQVFRDTPNSIQALLYLDLIAPGVYTIAVRIGEQWQHRQFFRQ